MAQIINTSEFDKVDFMQHNRHRIIITNITRLTITKSLSQAGSQTLLHHLKYKSTTVTKPQHSCSMPFDSPIRKLTASLIMKPPIELEELSSLDLVTNLKYLKGLELTPAHFVPISDYDQLNLVINYHNVVCKLHEVNRQIEQFNLQRRIVISNCMQLVSQDRPQTQQSFDSSIS